MGYCGQNDYICHCSLIYVRSDPKTQEGSFLRSFRALIKLIKSSDERCQKVELKTWQGCILEICHVCLFVCLLE